MFSSVSKLVVACAVLALSACGGDISVQQVSQAQPAPAPAPVMMASYNGAVASDSERMAEAVRTADFEQSYSIEMNRRHAEQVERATRIASAKQAGVQQSPGCEGTIGHDAQECEQLVSTL